MNTNHHQTNISVDSEISQLERIIIHSPDGGLGKIVPTKAQDWLFEDIVHLETMRKCEYDYYVKLLLYFLDPEKVKGKLADIDSADANRAFYKPDNDAYFNSDKVLDPQFMLSEILEDTAVRSKLVASVCAHESTSYVLQEKLLALPSKDLAKTIISGSLPDGKMIFGPIPNFIFTRDIGIVVNKHILLTRPKKAARKREGILTRFILFNHPVFEAYRNNIIEITNHEEFFLLSDEEQQNKAVTVEGGDVMTVAPNHLLIGCSERTTIYGCQQVIKKLFENKVVEKVTVVKIPEDRSFMHIDTTFTQVKRDMWVIYGPFGHYNRKSPDMVINSLGGDTGEINVEIFQFSSDKSEPKKFNYIEDLLNDISQNDLKSKTETTFIYSGGGEFPYGQREQWTDSCNVLALKEGVVIGYDRNNHTAKAFAEKGINSITAPELLDQFEKGITSPEELKNTLILLPSGELSRARGGSHCMSMPILRKPILPL